MASKAPDKEPATGKAPRKSVRQSLNLATVSKALADVMNKDSEKQGAKTRRSSSLVIKPSTSARPSLSNVVRPSTPDSKTVTGTRRRVSAATSASATSVDEHGAKEVKESKEKEPSDSKATITRTSSLRPRPSTSSSLPKYRPRSIRLDNGKKSPPRVGSRRRHSICEEEDEDKTTVDENAKDAEEREDKSGRPISPLPSRALRPKKTVPTAAATAKSKGSASQPPKQSTPARPSKILKSSSSKAGVSTPPRPSSTNSDSSRTSSPTRIALLKNARAGQGTPTKTKTSVPVNSSPLRKRESPVPVRRKDNNSPQAGDMSRISEGNTEELENVAMLLVPGADLSAPTPAMPRLKGSQTQQGRKAPTTPTKASKVTLKSKGPVMVPMPDDDSPRRRTLKSGSEKAPRSSILSWEQFKDDASRTLDEEDIGRMLGDIDVPFNSGTISPSVTFAGLAPGSTDSPALSRLNSPAGYGSIAHVMLPQVTPSPAAHVNRSQQLADATVSSDSAQITLLKLQLASVEQTAKERLLQVQALEEEVHHVKQAREQETETLTSQVAQLEEHIRGKLAASSRTEEERNAYMSSLEEQIQQEAQSREDAVAEAVEEATAEAEEAHSRDLQISRRAWEMSSCAKLAATAWASALDGCQHELELIQSDRDVISVLLPQLESLHDKLVMELQDSD